MTAEEIKILIRQMSEDYGDRSRWINTKSGKQLMLNYQSLLTRLLERIEDADRRKANGG